MSFGFARIQVYSTYYICLRTSELNLMDQKSRKPVLLIFAFLYMLSSTCAVRINVDHCPGNKTTWQAKSQIFVCKHPEVYHCIQDENGKLMEACMEAYEVNPSHEGGCPWAFHDLERDTILGIPFHTCDGIGCPQKNDSSYWTDQLYKYPICLYKTKEDTDFTTSPSHTEITNKEIEGKDGNNAPMIVIGVVVVATMVAIAVVVIVIWRKKKSNDSAAGIDIEDYIVSRNLLISDDESNCSLHGEKSEEGCQSQKQLSKINLLKAVNEEGQTALHIACLEGNTGLIKRLIDVSEDLLHIKDNNGSLAFHLAGFSGSVELVQYLIDNGCDVYSKDNTGQTIAHKACRKGHFKLIKFLLGLEKKLLNVNDNNGCTPFHCVGFSGSVELVQYLMENGFDLYSMDVEGRTVVHHACQEGHIDMTKYLVGLDKELLKVKDRKGITPFHLAGLSGSVELVQYLIDNSCDVNSKDMDGRTIVYYSCEEGNVDVVKLLIGTDKEVLNQKDSNGRTPFHCAGFSGSGELVQYLIDSECNLYDTDNGGRTIVHHACQEGHKDLVNFLFELDKEMFNQKDKNGITPFHLVGLSGSVDFIQHLMNDGYVLNRKDNEGRTVVHYACQGGHVEMVKYLTGIDKEVLNEKDNNGITPFHLAGFSGSVKLLKYLIEKGCDLYSKDNESRIIVHYACQEGHVDMIKYLMKRTRDKDILQMKDNKGITPFHLAGFSGSVELVQYLIFNDCGFYSRNNEGRTIVHYSCEAGHVGIVKLLIGLDKDALNQKDTNGVKPFHCAGFSGSIDLVKYLLSEGCDLRTKDNSGQTIVHNVCLTGHIDLMKHLMGINKDILNIKDNNGTTPLQCAEISGSVELIQYLKDVT